MGKGGKLEDRFRRLSAPFLCCGVMVLIAGLSLFGYPLGVQWLLVKGAGNPEFVPNWAFDIMMASASPLPWLYDHVRPTKAT